MVNAPQLRYLLQGERENPYIVFLHGFMGQARDWRRVTAALQERYCCVSIDLPGHGDSTALAEDAYTMPGAAAAVVRTLDQLGIKEAALVGYSMGGRLALYLAVHYPARFPRVILESASPGLRTEAERRQRRAHDNALAGRLESSTLEDFLAEWYAQPMFDTLRQHANFLDIQALRLRNHTHELARSLRCMGTGSQPSLWDELQHIKMPLFLLTGELDDKFRAIAADMAGRCPRARVHIIAGAGHNIHFEKTSEFIAVLSTCLTHAEEGK